MTTLSHINKKGDINMVDVGDKKITKRKAIASAEIIMQKSTLNSILADTNKKGNVLATARIAGIQAGKKCWDLIPLCHPLTLSKISIDLTADKQNNSIKIKSIVESQGRTGVEMEALTAACIAALTIYDMCKAQERSMSISKIHLLEKTGGKSGHYKAYL